MIAKTGKKKIISYFFEGIFVAFLICFFTALFCSAYYFRTVKTYENLIFPNVYVDNRNFGGKTKHEINEYFQKKNKSLETLVFSVKFTDETVATFSARELKIGYNPTGISDQAFLIGRSENSLSKFYQRVSSILGTTQYTISANIQYDQDPISDFLSNMETQNNLPAKNALFKFENGRVVAFREEEKGKKIESDIFLKDFENAVSSLKKKPQNKTLTLLEKIIDPEVTLKEANQFGIEELIATGISNYSHSSPERIHNVLLAASKFNGVMMEKGKVFSFNDTIGDISGLTGYAQAYVIKAGKTVLGDGGGVCQVSTTLFRAALNAGLPIVERTAHAYRVGYYENDSKPGFDATVFAPYTDLKIKNDTEAAILIETEVDQENNLLTFKLFGKKDERVVNISPVVVSGIAPPPPDVYQDDPTLKKGVVKQVDFAAWGAKADFNYKVTKNGSEIFEKEFFSSYRPWAAVYLRGTAD